MNTLESFLLPIGPGKALLTWLVLHLHQGLAPPMHLRVLHSLVYLSFGPTCFMVLL